MKKTIKLDKPLLLCTTCWGNCGQCGGNGHKVMTDRVPSGYNPDEYLPEGQLKYLPEGQLKLPQRSRYDSILKVLDILGIVLLGVFVIAILIRLHNPS